MKRIIISEIKTGMINLRFLAGMVLLGTVMLAVANPYYRDILRIGVAGPEPAWFMLFRYGVLSENLLMMIPLLVPLAAGGMAESELRSRFALFSYYRSGKKGYVLGKYLAALVSGGFMILIASLLFLAVCVAGVGSVNTGQEVDMTALIPVIRQDCLRLFLNGGMWAVAGALSAILCKNIYMSFAVPFILYYVLTVFQSRYYSSLPALSPRYWVLPQYYSSLVCIGILLVLLLLCGCGYWLAIRRRIEHG